MKNRLFSCSEIMFGGRFVEFAQIFRPRSRAGRRVSWNTGMIGFTDSGYAYWISDLDAFDVADRCQPDVSAMF